MMHLFTTVAAFHIFFSAVKSSSISNPLRENGDIGKVIPDYFDTKRFKDYHNSTPSVLENVPVISYNSPDPACNVGFRLLWSSQVGSSVFGTPVIFPSGWLFI
jgi:hypothetical protein